MPPIEEYLEKADILAQDVVNAWGVNMQAGSAPRLTNKFKELFNKACLYQNARRLAKNHRQFHALSEEEAAEEQATRQAFAEACKAFYEKQATGA
jgi:hypothetical protein